MAPPIATHAVPFHRAAQPVVVVPDALNWPLAIRSPFGATASAYTHVLKPLPSGDQMPVAGSSIATFAAGIEPANVNAPPATILSVSGPAPAGSHATAAQTEPSRPGSPSP